MPTYRTLAELLAEAAADLADLEAAVVEYDEYIASREPDDRLRRLAAKCAEYNADVTRRAALETPTVAELNAQFDMGEEE